MTFDLTVTSPPYGNLRAFKFFKEKKFFRLKTKGGVVVWCEEEKEYELWIEEKEYELRVQHEKDLKDEYYRELEREEEIAQMREEYGR